MFKYVAGIVAFFVAWYYLGEIWQVIAPFLFVIFIYHKVYKFVVGFKASIFKTENTQNAIAPQGQHSQVQVGAQSIPTPQVKRAPEPVQQLTPNEESEEEFIARVRAMNS